MNKRLAALLGRAVSDTDTKADEITREYRPCCGGRVTRCPHGFRWVKRNRSGIINRAARRHPSGDLLLTLSKVAGRDVTAAEVRGTIGRRKPGAPRRMVPINKALAS